MKGIVDAAKEGGVKFGTAAVVDVDNKNAGKLFGTAAGADAAGAADVAKAAAAVGVVSGEQILKAIAAAAGTGNHEGKRVLMLRMQFRLLLVVVRVRILMIINWGRRMIRSLRLLF
ncbi:variable large family protein [Borreliella turdi]|uniref:variable large family protein n=1 Tax=Borreliella turdi TaxID=57863 RepID=UPI0015629891|nr:variable large family protein [Borreliella turdi]